MRIELRSGDFELSSNQTYEISQTRSASRAGLTLRVPPQIAGNLVRVAG
jgi:hypothetical protein